MKIPKNSLLIVLGVVVLVAGVFLLRPSKNRLTAPEKVIEKETVAAQGNSEVTTEVSAEEDVISKADVQSAPVVVQKDIVERDPLGAPAPGSCVRLTFRHKASAGHPDKRHCRTHRNFLRVPVEKDLNWKSVCLRVDGTPTPFDRTSGGITFGPVAGPASIVSLRFCRGKATCQEDCNLPKDPFFEAIGSTLQKVAVGKMGGAGQWDPADTQEDPDAAVELEVELREHVPNVHGLTTFKDWMATGRVKGCGTIASKEDR